MHDFLLFLLVGFLAQVVDGALGMAYGVISSTVLLSFGVPPATASASVHAAEVFTTAASAGGRIYQGACAVCHEVGGPPLFGSRPSLALNSNLHSDVPDNLIQVILHGIAKPAATDLGYMPAFKDSMSDSQVAELVGFLRRQFAPARPAWADVAATVGRIRQTIAR